MIEIRTAQDSDIPALARFMAQMEAELGKAAPIDQVERDLRQRPAGVEFLVATSDQAALAGLASFSMLYPSSGSGLSQLLYLKELYVAPPFRRQGIARRLMGRLAVIARERGCPRLGWNTPRDNTAAQALYDGLGADRAEWLLTYRLGGDALEALAASAD